MNHLSGFRNVVPAQPQEIRTNFMEKLETALILQSLQQYSAISCNKKKQSRKRSRTNNNEDEERNDPRTGQFLVPRARKINDGMISQRDDPPCVSPSSSPAPMTDNSSEIAQSRINEMAKRHSPGVLPIKKRFPAIHCATQSTNTDGGPLSSNVMMFCPPISSTIPHETLVPRWDLNKNAMPNSLLSRHAFLLPSPTPILSVKTFIPAEKKKHVAKKVKICRMDDCSHEAAKRTSYCGEHSGPRTCEFDACSKCAQGRTRFCIAHGGGRRCTAPNCQKAARDKKFCAGHGGGKRCHLPECGKMAVGRSTLCTGHGGGRRCQDTDCAKSAQSNTNFCVRHGGGRKCTAQGCTKAARGRSEFCMSHRSTVDIQNKP
uniref:WRKY19-like zinc finger domain-containing protein n=1 Tax=Attheya septentrionalis TaxID=420275 RepID=A0A7S2XSF8_9STRA|mmetsp:Transcript_5286/g.9295  ORF Transcript_5286/g.9295 Transcript_5286/m.9295 type:complete len:374 (+) Transcript_5286:93-1214(+)